MYLIILLGDVLIFATVKFLRFIVQEVKIYLAISTLIVHTFVKATSPIPAELSILYDYFRRTSGSSVPLGMKRIESELTQ